MEEFYTYDLPEDKPLSVVIKGIPIEFPFKVCRRTCFIKATRFCLYTA